MENTNHFDLKFDLNNIIDTRQVWWHGFSLYYRVYNILANYLLYVPFLVPLCSSLTVDLCVCSSVWCVWDW